MTSKQFQLAAVNPGDAERLVRDVDFPAMQDGPLYRSMFTPTTSESDLEEIIRFYIVGLESAVSTRPDRFCQIRDSEGVPVAFSGWTLDQANAPGAAHSTQEGKSTTLPACLDKRAWQCLSNELRAERRRALIGLNNICRMHQSHSI